MEDEMFCFAVLADKIDGTIYLDQTGRFPIRSLTNYILLRSLASRTDVDMSKAFKDLYAYLEEHNLKPKLHVLDNKCSRAIKSFIRKEGADIQLVKPHNHRVNAAETVVKTAKYHMIASLAMLDPSCPL